MDPILLISIVAFFASMLTFFSGFGLGTILTPFFILFFPVDTAIILTAIVHFLNNIFKLSMIGKNIDFRILMRFGLPAIAGAFAGARVLLFLPQMNPLYEYTFMSKNYSVMPLNLILAFLMILFSVLEIAPKLNRYEFAKENLLIGGIVSGFFGGLSGNQGALRSMFLIKVNLTKEVFIATGVGIACMVDISRMSVYFFHFDRLIISENYSLVLIAVLSAFSGAYIGNKLLKKVTYKFLQIFVSITIILLSLALGAGLI